MWTKKLLDREILASNLKTNEEKNLLEAKISTYKNSEEYALTTVQKLNDNKDFEIEDENGIKHINIPSLSEGAEYKVITINTDGDKTSVRSKIISVE